MTAPANAEKVLETSGDEVVPAVASALAAAVAPEAVLPPAAPTGEAALPRAKRTHDQGAEKENAARKRPERAAAQAANAANRKPLEMKVAAAAAVADAAARAQDQLGAKASEAYALTHTIGFLERVPDTFYDAGRGLFRPIKDLEQPVQEGREVLFVDMGGLQKFFKEIKPQIDRLTDKLEQYRKLSSLIHDAMGGQHAAQDTASSEQDVEAIKRELNSNVVPLHTLIGRNGLCRHRALLFKVCCDFFGFDCLLLRGEVHDGTKEVEGHAWNVVKTGRSAQELMLCDVMRHPGQLLNVDKLPAKYFRLIAGDNDGGSGLTGPVPALPKISTSMNIFRRDDFT